MFVPMDSSNDQQQTRERPYWILIGAGAAGTNRYAWTQINDTDATGGFPDFNGAFSMSGGSGANDWPAYEITGREDVPPDTKVLAHISASGKFWIFKYEGEGTAGGGCAAINAGMDTDDCLYVTVLSASGLCSTIDTTQVSVLVWDAGDSRWESTYDFDTTGSGTDGPVHFGFTNGVPWMTIDGVYGTPMGCDDGGLLFSFGGAVLCAGGTETLCENYFVVKVECSCCPIDGWEGPGWYCVVAAGDTCGVDQQYCVELLHGDRCDTDIVICSGKYASEAACDGACTGAIAAVNTDCCTNPIPETLNWTITAKVGVCSCAPTSGTVTYDAVDSRWESVVFSCALGECEENAEYYLECVGGTWYFGTKAATSVTCPEDGALSIAFNMTPTFGGSYTITFTA